MFGQPQPNITITAPRTNVIQPDQVLAGLNVTSGTTAGLDDITGAFTGAGIAGGRTSSGFISLRFIQADAAHAIPSPPPSIGLRAKRRDGREQKGKKGQGRD